MDQSNHETNILGQPLATCSLSPLTGFNRDGACRMPNGDFGRHGVCAEVTADFLNFTRGRGNDLSTPQPLYGFPGLKPGDRWCLCADRWAEAAENGMAPPVVLSATHADVLARIPMERLVAHALTDEREN
ncbi:MAG: DUF2237 domain-containing protein [Desulfobacterales bacterium]|nr:DUF2237 domain-containing protein [Desulfobacterales bacterium]